jgi:hypothetical protein
MPNAVHKVVREREGEKGLATVLDKFGKSCDKVDYVCTVKDTGCSKIGEGEGVED